VLVVYTIIIITIIITTTTTDLCIPLSVTVGPVVPQVGRLGGGARGDRAAGRVRPQPQ
jgi:hypothetical protein